MKCSSLHALPAPAIFRARPKTRANPRDRCLSHFATLGIPLAPEALDALLSKAEKEGLSGQIPPPPRPERAGNVSSEEPHAARSGGECASAPAKVKAEFSGTHGRFPAGGPSRRAVAGSTPGSISHPAPPHPGSAANIVPSRHQASRPRSHTSSSHVRCPRACARTCGFIRGELSALKLNRGGCVHRTLTVFLSPLSQDYVHWARDDAWGNLESGFVGAGLLPAKNSGSGVTAQWPRLRSTAHSALRHSRLRR